jgi:hypothetical protein
LSLSSSLNMNYLDSVGGASPYTLIGKNLVSHIFKKNHYRYINIESGYAITGNQVFADKTIHTPGLNEFESRLLELTILRLDDVLGFTGYTRVKGELDKMKLFVEEPGPKFCFIHIVAPHPPYVVDSSGNQKIRSSISDMAWEPRSDYVGQLQYVSRKVAEFIDLIEKRSPSKPVIIVQSDHGPWLSDPDRSKVYEARSRILNAYLVPDSLRTKLYQTITPVNSFRLLFPGLLGLHIDPVPDRPFSFAQFQNDPTFKKYVD